MRIHASTQGLQLGLVCGGPHSALWAPQWLQMALQVSWKLNCFFQVTVLLPRLPNGLETWRAHRGMVTLKDCSRI